MIQENFYNEIIEDNNELESQIIEKESSNISNDTEKLIQPYYLDLLQLFYLNISTQDNIDIDSQINPELFVEICFKYSSVDDEESEQSDKIKVLSAKCLVILLEKNYESTANSIIDYLFKFKIDEFKLLMFTNSPDLNELIAKILHRIVNKSYHLSPNEFMEANRKTDYGKKYCDKVIHLLDFIMELFPITRGKSALLIKPIHWLLLQLLETIGDDFVEYLYTKEIFVLLTTYLLQSKSNFYYNFQKKENNESKFNDLPVLKPDVKEITDLIIRLYKYGSNSKVNNLLILAIYSE